MSVRYLVIPYLNSEQVIAWLESASIPIADQAEEGRYPYLSALVSVIESLPDCTKRKRLTPITIEFDIVCGSFAVTVEIFVDHLQQVTHLSFVGNIEIVSAIVRRLAFDHGSFIITENGEPLYLVSSNPQNTIFN